LIARRRIHFSYLSEQHGRSQAHGCGDTERGDDGELKGLLKVLYLEPWADA
jgi:hypothetical protein